ncbi:MAG: thioredoxin, partial [Solirubrobacteraceae bacterium]
LQQRLFELTTSPARDLVRGAGGSPEGIDPQWVSDPEMPVGKFAAPERIKIVHAGGDAGLFSMVFGSWAAGEIGSAPVSEAVAPWA